MTSNSAGPNVKLEPADGAKAPRARSRRRTRDDAPVIDRRTQILQVSARFFAEYGFEGTSVRKIADEVNILAGSLYHHFATKEEILHEIMRAPLEQMLREYTFIGKLPVDPEHKLVANILLRFHRYIYQSHFYSIFKNDGKFFRRKEEFAYVEDVKHRVFHLQEAVLKEGMAVGQFHEDVDAYLMIGTLVRLLSSGADWFRGGEIVIADHPAIYTFDRVVDFHLDCALRMVRTPSRIEEPIPRAACEKLLVFD